MSSRVLAGRQAAMSVCIRCGMEHNMSCARRLEMIERIRAEGEKAGREAAHGECDVCSQPNPSVSVCRPCQDEVVAQARAQAFEEAARMVDEWNGFGGRGAVAERIRNRAGLDSDGTPDTGPGLEAEFAGSTAPAPDDGREKARPRGCTCVTDGETCDACSPPMEP